MQFSLHWGWQCTVPNELPNVGPGDAPKGALHGLGRGVDTFICAVSCWQCVKNRKGLVEVHSFHCIGGGSVLSPMSCQTLGRAMRRKVRRLAWAEACMLFCVLSS